mgnify:CR=1 FL=1
MRAPSADQTGPVSCVRSNVRRVGDAAFEISHPHVVESVDGVRNRQSRVTRIG